jgi:hypothetical protein
MAANMSATGAGWPNSTWIDCKQDIRVLVGLAPDHHAIEVGRCTSHSSGWRDAAIDGDGQAGLAAFSR